MASVHFCCCSLSAAGPIASGRRVHVLLKVAELLVLLGQLARFEAAGERQRLIAQLGLHAGQELGGLGGLLLRGVLIASAASKWRR